MSDVLSIKEVKTRKSHRCYGCGRSFPPGTVMEVSAVAEDGTVWCCYMCNTCREIEKSLDPDESFGWGDLLQDALELEGKS